MVLKVNSLSRGFSGIRRVVIDALIALINAEVYPHIPLKGSVGASGDLAPLAHMSLVLLEGKARYKGEWMEATEALKVAGLTPLTLAAKEGLALLNGTQVSTAFALRGLFEGEDLFAGALAIGGLTVEAVLGSRSPFDARIHAARGQKGQIDAAAAYRDLLGERSGLRFARTAKGPGPVLPALPAASHGRLPDPVPPGRRSAGHRSQRRVGQPVGVRR
jgi:histidine ammonia-lyase